MALANKRHRDRFKANQRIGGKFFVFIAQGFKPAAGLFVLRARQKRGQGCLCRRIKYHFRFNAEMGVKR